MRGFGFYTRSPCHDLFAVDDKGPDKTGWAPSPPAGFAVVIGAGNQRSQVNGRCAGDSHEKGSDDPILALVNVVQIRQTFVIDADADHLPLDAASFLTPDVLPDLYIDGSRARARRHITQPLQRSSPEAAASCVPIPTLPSRSRHLFLLRRRELSGPDEQGAMAIRESSQMPELLRLPLPPPATTGSPYSVCLSVPASPSGLHLGVCASVRSVAPAPQPQPAEDQQLLQNQARYHSQPTLTIRTEEPPPLQRVRTVSRSDSARDRRFDHFKTFSGRLERQLSNLRGVVPVDIEPAGADSTSNKIISEEETDDDDEVPSADRYFAALEGPELETLRPTEVSALPEDETWPFLLRFPINAFGMCLGVSSQAMLWKTLQSEPSTAFLHVSPAVNHVLWWVSASK